MRSTGRWKSFLMGILLSISVSTRGVIADDSASPLPFPDLSESAPTEEVEIDPESSPASDDVESAAMEIAPTESPSADQGVITADVEEPVEENSTEESEAVEASLIEEETFDLRVPGSGPLANAIEGEELVEPSWLNEVIDDHVLLWQPVTGSNDFVFRDNNGFGISTLNFKGEVGEDSGPIWTNLAFGWHLLSGPRQPDVPSQVYDLSLGIHIAKQVTPDWDFHAHFAPTFSTDWDNKSGDAWRMIGGALVSYEMNPALKSVVGFSYLDRPDLPVLPVAGFRWAITPDVYADILIPEPKIAYLLEADEDSSSWLYLKGQIGGGSWAIESAPDYDDRMGYRDLRLLFGFETARINGERDIFEFGYVFDRELHFDRRNLTLPVGDTWSLRFGRTY
ncbi:MAG: hypothetical protein KDA80_14470 [Planctomycetaceae bacterium]|nr:hypothetical protein [Planctomycetaceae bacterium]